MATGGRVLHHLEQRLPDARNAVLLAGFQAEGSRGRALQEGAKSIHFYGRDVPVHAEIVSIGQLSAHAGKSELLRWLGALPSAPKQTYLTHGEPQAAQSLQSAIAGSLHSKADVARYLQTVDLD
jgi:metallo-beta-lactamase family protein